MPGCGKTTIAKELSKLLQLDCKDIDEIIVEKENMPITDIFQKGEPYFRQLEHNIVEEVSKQTTYIISTGGGVIKDAENMSNLKESGIVIFINRSISNIASTIEADTRPLIKNNLDNLIKLYNERLPLYKIYSQYEVTNDGNIDEVINQILKIIDCER
jgi:Shikimate kinase